MNRRGILECISLSFHYAASEPAEAHKTEIMCKARKGQSDKRAGMGVSISNSQTNDTPLVSFKIQMSFILKVRELRGQILMDHHTASSLQSVHTNCEWSKRVAASHSHLLSG